MEGKTRTLCYWVQLNGGFLKGLKLEIAGKLAENVNV